MGPFIHRTKPRVLSLLSLYFLCLSLSSLMFALRGTSDKRFFVPSLFSFYLFFPRVQFEKREGKSSIQHDFCRRSNCAHQESFERRERNECVCARLKEKRENEGNLSPDSPKMLFDFLARRFLHFHISPNGETLNRAGTQSPGITVDG